MKLDTFLSASLLLSAFAAGCAAESTTAPVAANTQTDEASAALGRAAVKGVYVRSVSSSSCNTATSVELRGDGTFLATVDYVPFGRMCVDLPMSVVNGNYSVNRRSNVVTFRQSGSRAAFSLRLASNSLDRVAGSTYDRAIYEGSFRKLEAGECMNDAGCASSQFCEPLAYALGAEDPTDPRLVYPPVGTGVCVDRHPPPLDPTGCTAEYAPVCGSDGVTYSSACQAGLVPGVTVAHQGKCLAAPRS